VKSGTDTIISCIITGLTQAATVSWYDSTGLQLTSTTTTTRNHNHNEEQITTLEVASDAVTSDAVYTCEVTSGEYPDSDPQDTEVNLNVYSKFKWILIRFSVFF
jgi:hypothetical protein